MYAQTCCADSASGYARAFAHGAKIELLRERVKARVEKTDGEKLDKLADLIVGLYAAESRSLDESAQRQVELEDALEEF